MSADDKTGKLNAIIEKMLTAQLIPLHAKLDAGNASSNDLAKKMSELQATLSVIQARVFLSDSTGATAATKKAAKATVGRAAASKTGGAKKTGSVTNALLFFKKAAVDDIEDVRSTYLTDTVIEDAKENDDACAKVDESDPTKYWNAIAKYYWTKRASEGEKTNIKALFKTYKENLERDAADEPLEQDDGDDE